jgi:hypothetical protein
MERDLRSPGATEGICAMLGLMLSPTQIAATLDSRKNIPNSILNQGPLELSEESFSEFLNQPRREQLTKAHELPFLAAFELVARSRGKLVLSAWLEDTSPFRAIHEMQAEAPDADLFQLTLVTGLVPLDFDQWHKALTARKNGRFGLEIILHGMTHRVSPLQTIATNKQLAKFFAEKLEEKRLSVNEFFAIGGKLNLLNCKQFLLQCGKSARAMETYRGNRIIEADQPPGMLAERIISGISRWFMSNQDQEGALPYKYWPSSGRYSDSDNPIRRFMASVAFNRMASAFDRHDMKAAARKNLDYNLRRFYRAENDQGLIAWNGSVKLGSLALAALAIIESPFAENWSEELKKLRQTIDALWQPSGAFKTFLHPEDRNDNQNFYPGEALLFWATSLQKKADEALLSKAMKSFHYYRNHFRKDSNPAFVPWHTQAALILYRISGDAEIREFIFEMNDWLLPHQQWGDPVDLDHWGRFYSPKKPDYGPPHASATGVYLEGLADALILAREAGDKVRTTRYQQAIERGIRSLAQLQYRDDIDAYYVSRKEKVIGAIRTETYNNEIRIDNLQHGLMALLKYREIDQELRLNPERPESPLS